MDWKLLISLLSFPTVLGVIIDTWMTAKQKSMFYEQLCFWFIEIDDTPLLDFPKLMATNSVNIIHKIFRRKWFSAISLFILALGSSLLTIIALFIGDFIGHQTFSFAMTSFHERMSFFHILLPINFFFDGLTLLITLNILANLSEKINFYSIALVMFDIMLAFVFSILCLSFAAALTDDYNIITEFTEFTDQFILFIKYFPHVILKFIHGLLKWNFNGIIDPAAILYSCTTLLPTIFYFLIFYILVLIRFIFWIGRLFTIQWIIISVEDIPKINSAEASKKFKPFTLIGMAFSSLVAFFKIIQEITL